MKIKKIIILNIILLFLLQDCIVLAKSNDAKLIEQGYSYLAKVEKNENPSLNIVYLNKAQHYFYITSKRDNPKTDALLGLGITYMLKGKYSDAKKVLSQAYSMDYRNPKSNFYYAELLYVTQNYAAALEFYKKSMEYGSYNRPAALEKIASCYEKLGDIDNAIVTYKKIDTQKAKEKIEELQNAKLEILEE